MMGLRLCILGKTDGSNSKSQRMLWRGAQLKLRGLLQKARGFISDNSPGILTGVGVAGVLSTVVLAVRATPEAMVQIWDAESGGDKATPIQKATLTWRLYLPAAISGAATITAIVMAHSSHAKRNAALMSVYTLTERAFKEYRDEVIFSEGEHKDRKIRDEVAHKRSERDPVDSSQVIVTGTGDSLCYDSVSGRYFKSSVEKIRKAQNDINHAVLNHMYVSHNEFYRAIGLPPTSLGEELGWTTENMMDIEYTSILSEDNDPALYLDYKVSPIRNYYRFS